jgi:hypothetical protein
MQDRIAAKHGLDQHLQHWAWRDAHLIRDLARQGAKHRLFLGA